MPLSAHLLMWTVMIKMTRHFEFILDRVLLKQRSRRMAHREGARTIQTWMAVQEFYNTANVKQMSWFLRWWDCNDKSLGKTKFSSFYDLRRFNHVERTGMPLTTKELRVMLFLNRPVRCLRFRCNKDKVYQYNITRKRTLYGTNRSVCR
jgi:hypothetical protein